MGLDGARVGQDSERALEVDGGDRYTAVTWAQHCELRTYTW